MKKISFTLLTLLCISMLSGCRTGSEVTGTDAAKLLLANERLDSDSIGNIFNISRSAKQVNNANTNLKRARVINENNINYAITGVKVDVDGDTYVWDEFGNYSNSTSYFDSFVNSINNQTKDASKLIEKFKDVIESNNIWVKSLGTEYLLQVTSENDTIIKRNDDYYQIVNHNINDKAIDEYEIYSYNLQKQGGTRVKKIGDYRYEFANVDIENDFYHHFIADKSRGYWTIYSPVNDTQFNVNILKDDRCYEFTIDVSSCEILALDIISSDGTNDMVYSNYGRFEIYAGSIENLKSFSIVASKDQIGSVEDLNYDNVLFESDGQYGTTGKKYADVTFTNGVTIKPSQKFVNDNVTVEGGNVNILADGMYPTIMLDIQGNNYKERIENFKKFVSEANIQFKGGNEQLFKSIEYADNDSAHALKGIVWNGYEINSVDNLAKAYEYEVNLSKAYQEKIHEVKDNTVLSRNAQGKLDRNTNFPYIVKSSFSATYENNMVNINSATAKIDDFKLFEQGQKYNMQFALAKYDEENEGYSSIIPLDVENSAYVTYNGEKELTLSTDKLSFVIPTPSTGTYELVTYISNEEGIRVSRPLAVTFENVVSSEISLDNYTATVSKSDENILDINSKENANIVLVIDEPKTNYTYEEIYDLLVKKAFTYGVVGNSKVEILSPNNTWTVLTGYEDALSSGNYRLEFTNNSDEKIYVTTKF